ncbi:hypothetical protein B0H14DRAFT_2631040 [Mycena olivaceomarginata]|nr:hypothetical protein B0H14DRAFT_2631040 [Mycena olivaceomarginata]
MAEQGAISFPALYTAFPDVNVHWPAPELNNKLNEPPGVPGLAVRDREQLSDLYPIEEGAYGTVVAALHRPQPRKVAIKQIRSLDRGKGFTQVHGIDYEETDTMGYSNETKQVPQIIQ